MAQIKDVKSFGLGYFVLVDNTGTSAQPRPVAIVENVDIEWAGSTTELRGQNQFPDDVAVTSRKISGKAKLKTVNAKLIASLLPGSTTATGTTLPNKQVVSAAATITAAYVTGHTDLGVLGANQALMTRVTSVTTSGTYALAAGVYTFHASETGDLTLMYSYTVTTGFTVSHTNTSAGSQSNFLLKVFNTYTDNAGAVNSIGYNFYAVKCPKLATSLKVTDYSDYDIDFECVADPTTGKTFDAFASS